MHWPTPQEYNEAIQTPLISFADPELRRGTLALTPIGIPWAMTGAFASVYKMTTEAGDWAIRCFLTHRPDQGERYQKISHFVSMDELEETVAFHYIDQGIRVHGTWYPILKMEWVYGDTFEVYLQKHYRDQKKVAELLEQFDRLVHNLDLAGIAHGDLQHGNIIVSDKGLRLVDYDALFVPELAGKMSLELGHPNYQHPNRNEYHYDTTVDNFSCWLIHYSLLALSIDPGLYEISGGGDDCILFRRSDLRAPEASELFEILSNHSSQEISRGAALLMRMLWANPECVPELNAPQDEYEQLPTVKPDFDDTREQERRELLYFVEADTSESADKDTFHGTRFDADRGILVSSKPKPVGKKKKRSTIFSRFENRCRKIVEYVERDIFTGTWYFKRIKQGDRHLRAGRYHESGDIYLELYRFYNTTWLKPYIFDLYLKLGYSFAMQQKFSLAQNYFLLALRESDARDNNDKARAALLLAVVRYIKEEYDEAYNLFTGNQYLPGNLAAVLQMEKEVPLVKRPEVFAMLFDFGKRLYSASPPSGAALKQERLQYLLGTALLYWSIKAGTSIKLDRFAVDLYVQICDALYLKEDYLKSWEFFNQAVEICRLIIAKDATSVPEEEGENSIAYFFSAAGIDLADSSMTTDALLFFQMRWSLEQVEDQEDLMRLLENLELSENRFIIDCLETCFTDDSFVDKFRVNDLMRWAHANACNKTLTALKSLVLQHGEVDSIIEYFEYLYQIEDDIESGEFSVAMLATRDRAFVRKLLLVSYSHGYSGLAGMMACLLYELSRAADNTELLVTLLDMGAAEVITWMFYYRIRENDLTSINNLALELNRVTQMTTKMSPHREIYADEYFMVVASQARRSLKDRPLSRRRWEESLEQALKDKFGFRITTLSA